MMMGRRSTTTTTTTTVTSSAVIQRKLNNNDDMRQSHIKSTVNQVGWIELSHALHACIGTLRGGIWPQESSFLFSSGTSAEELENAWLTTTKSAKEQCQFTDQVFCPHAPDRIGRSNRVAAKIEKNHLGVAMTAHNFRTVMEKILEMTRVVERLVAAREAGIHKRWNKKGTQDTKSEQVWIGSLFRTSACWFFQASSSNGFREKPTAGWADVERKKTKWVSGKANSRFWWQQQKKVTVSALLLELFDGCERL
jgi:hypothetical protein